MDCIKIGKFIKQKRKNLNLTQEELANKLMVTEKAVSRWETGRGTPDISLLIPLSKELNVTLLDLLNGGEEIKQEEIVTIIHYIELCKKGKYNIPFFITVFYYLISVIIFLFYLKLEYNPMIELNYFYRLFLILLSSFFVILGNKFFLNNYIDKIEDRKVFEKRSKLFIFIYYVVFIFNIVIFARYGSKSGYQLYPFRTIISIITGNETNYFKVINLFGNFLIYFPFVYFFSQLFNGNTWRKQIIFSFATVFLIETMQFIFKCGIFDIDDFILDLSGMYLFFLLYKRYIYKNI